jgi:hypothetical protein
MRKVQVYIGGQRLELFDDETISVTSSIQNVSDISKIFTDFSQSFTVPASNINNAIFAHFYNSDVEGNFLANVRVNAKIEIDTIPFRSGKIQLEKANIKNNMVESYTITFYGETVSLKDRFKEEKLNILDLSDLNFTYSGGAVKTRVTTGGTQNVRFPLIATERAWQYGGGGANDISISAGAISFTELFPAVKVSKVFEAIENRYGVTFSGISLQDQRYTKLWLYCKNADRFDNFSEPEQVIYTDYNDTIINITNSLLTIKWPPEITSGLVSSKFVVYRRLRITVTPTTSVSYELIVLNEDGSEFAVFSGFGTQTFTIFDIKRSQNRKPFKIKIFIRASQSITFTTTLGYVVLFRISPFQGPITFTAEVYTQTSTSQTITPQLSLSNYLPDMKVADFFTGILRLFNWTIVPISATEFELETLEQFYNKGQILDITPFTETDNIDVERAKTFKKLAFQYENSESILNNQFENVFQRKYGNLDFENPNQDTGELSIKAPFECPIFSLLDTSLEGLTAFIINKDLNPYRNKPILLYENGLTPFSFWFNDGSSNTNESQYFRFSNELALGGDDLALVYSLCWGAEVSPFFLSTVTNSLFEVYWRPYIDNLYNPKTRMLKVDCILPLWQLIKLRLNDRVIIRDRRYIINQFTTDITKGEVKFELINDFRTLPLGTGLVTPNQFNTSNAAQTVESVIDLGRFDFLDIKNEAGFLTYNFGSYTADLVLSIDIAANGTAAERQQQIELTFSDLEGNTETQFITIIQEA